MCLVEVAKSPKPIASCAMPVVQGMKVFYFGLAKSYFERFLPTP
jgi:hypothetical protein